LQVFDNDFNQVIIKKLTFTKISIGFLICYKECRVVTENWWNRQYDWLSGS